MPEFFVTLIFRPGLSVKEFLDGKEPKIEFPSKREYKLPRRKSEAIEILQATLTDPSCPSMSYLLRRIGYKHTENLHHIAPKLCKKKYSATPPNAKKTLD